jgi:hypothetical protein
MKTFKELLKETRQLKDPKKDSLVTKDGKTIVIDKSKEAEYLKKGWTLSEEDLDEFGSRSMSAADKDNLRRRLKNKKESVNEAMNLNQLKKKYKNDLKQYEKDGSFKNDKAEQAFMGWATANGEVRTSDYAEFEKFMSDLLDGDFDDA